MRQADPDGQAKIVIPVLLRPMQVPDVLRLVQYLDATKGQPREDILCALRSAVISRLSEKVPPKILPSTDDARLELAMDLRPDTKTLVRVLRMARRSLANLETRAQHTRLQRYHRPLRSSLRTSRTKWRHLSNACAKQSTAELSSIMPRNPQALIWKQWFSHPIGAYFVTVLSYDLVAIHSPVRDGCQNSTRSWNRFESSSGSRTVAV